MKKTMRTRLIEERKYRRWSQQELANRLGTTQHNVSRWEQGLTTPGPYFRQKLCTLFDKSAEELELFIDSQSLTTPTHTETGKGASGAQPALSSSAHFPRVWGVPYPRNPFFTGRGDLLHVLHEQLNQEHATALTQSWTISGLGGIGKTQTVLEYVYRHSHDYIAIFWIRAETAESIVSSFITVADLLNLPERREHEQRLIVRAVIRWLSDQSGWLLVFDNVENPELVKDFLPPARHGSLLFTSRRQAHGLPAKTLTLEKMTPREGMHFLLHRARILDPMEQSPHLDPADETVALAIVAAMDGLPLALDQAGAYIEATHCSLSDYLQLLQSFPMRLLDERGAHADHPFSVTKTFSLTFEQVESRYALAAEVLTVCAHLAPEAIPEAFFSRGAAYLGPSFEVLAADPLQFNTVIKTLLAYSLLQRNATTHTITMHRLVQVVLKGRLSEASQRAWIGRVVRTMAEIFPSDEQQQADYWESCEQLLAHAQVCIALTEQWEEDVVVRITLQSRVASYFLNRAYYTEAEALFQRALRTGEQALGPEHPHIAYPLHGLADLARRQGKFAEAESLFQRVLHIREQALGAEHPLLAQSLNRLGLLYWEQGRFEQAEPLLLRTLHIREQALGRDNSLVAQSLNNLGILYHQQGKYEQAEPLYLHALHITERTLGPDHSQVAQPLNNLALLYMKQEKHEQAEQLFRRVVNIEEQSRGPEHPQFAYSLTNLGDLYREQGKYDQAESMYQRALRIGKQALGPDHPNLAYQFYGLGDLYREQEQYEQSEHMYQRALRIWEQALGPDHPLVADVLQGWGSLYREQGKYEQAESMYQRALKLRQQHLGSRHPDVAETLDHLARLHHIQHETAEALELYQQALAIRENTLGLCHAKTLATRIGYIRILQELSHV